LQHPIPESIYRSPPTPPEIQNAIQSLKTKKSAGNDDISSFFLRFIAKELSSYLCELFCYAFEFGVFPSRFKTARVIPIYKAGSKSEMTNYRPISLLTCFSKILEKLILHGLLKLLDKHNIFYTRQYGLRKKNSTIHAVMDIITQCYENMDNKQNSCFYY